jgi:hypothetical protein
MECKNDSLSGGPAVLGFGSEEVAVLEVPVPGMRTLAIGEEVTAGLASLDAIPELPQVSEFRGTADDDRERIGEDVPGDEVVILLAASTK